MSLTAALTLGNGIFNAFSSLSNNRTQAALSQASLNETRRANAEAEELARATREDAFGNKTQYTEGLGFETILTPLQQAIFDSQQNEQLAQFREDAPRQRAASERQDRRSQDADRVFDRIFRENEFAHKETEEDIQAEETLRAARNFKANKGDDDVIARQLLRNNDGNASAKLAQTLLGRGGSGQSSNGFNTVLDAAQDNGTNKFFAEDNAKTQALLAELGGYQSIADTTTSGGLNTSNESANLSNTANNALAQLTSVIQNSGASSAAALNNAGSVGNNPIDLSGIISGIEGLTQQNDPSATLLQQILMQTDLNNARLGLEESSSNLNTFTTNARDRLF